MRWFLLVTLAGCARPAPPSPPPVVEVAREPAPDGSAEPLPPAVVLAGRSADELLEAAGVATFVSDRELLVAAPDDDAMSRWFEQKPSSLYIYADRMLDVPGSRAQIRCLRAPRWESNVLNEVAVLVWRKAELRTILELGQSGVTVLEQRREGGEWTTSGVRSLPMSTIEWTDAQLRYAEAAEIYEVACVPVVREVACEKEGLAYCGDRELVVRPWLAPWVPHVGPRIPRYDDTPPVLPPGACAVQCEPSACDEALRRSDLPRAALYEPAAPTLAAFRTLAACRAYAASRTPETSGDW